MKRELSLFICLPVCGAEEQKEAVRKLRNQMDNLLERFRDDPAFPATALTSVFISSPCELPALPEIRQLLSCFALAKNAECTLEINRPLQHAPVSLYYAGINRISMKCSGDRAVLPPWTDNWPGRLNLDVHLDIQLPDVLPARLGHLSLYGKGTPGKWKHCRELLESRGFRQYELCHFARRGEASRQILNLYRMQPFIGIGPGAESTLPVRAGGIRILRRLEEKDSRRWLEQTDEGATEFFLEPAELMLEYFMMGFRLRSGLDMDDFRQTFGRHPVDCIPHTLAEWLERGLLELSPRYLGVTTEGFTLLDDLLRSIALEVIPRK